MTIPFKRIIRSKSNTKLFIEDLNIKLDKYGDEIDLLSTTIPNGNQYRTIEHIYKSNDLRNCISNNLCELITQDDDIITIENDPNLTSTFPVTMWELNSSTLGNLNLIQTSTQIDSTVSQTIDYFSTLTCKSSKWFFSITETVSGLCMSGEIIAIFKEFDTITYSEYSIVGDYLNYSLDVILEGNNANLICTNYEHNPITIRTTKIPISTTTNYSVNYGIGYGGVSDIDIYQPTKKTIIVIDGIQYYFYIEPVS